MRRLDGGPGAPYNCTAVSPSTKVCARNPLRTILAHGMPRGLSESDGYRPTLAHGQSFSDHARDCALERIEEL
jgi:hypothetical protein